MGSIATGVIFHHPGVRSAFRSRPFLFQVDRWSRSQFPFSVLAALECSHLERMKTLQTSQHVNILSPKGHQFIPWRAAVPPITRNTCYCSVLEQDSNLYLIIHYTSAWRPALPSLNPGLTDNSFSSVHLPCWLCQHILWHLWVCQLAPGHTN